MKTLRSGLSERCGYAQDALGPLRRYVEWERRWGLPINRFMANACDWLFVVVGPTAIASGVLFVVWGFWLGLIMIAIGLWMTWSGWTHMIRFVKPRLERDD